MPQLHEIVCARGRAGRESRIVRHQTEVSSRRVATDGRSASDNGKTRQLGGVRQLIRRQLPRRTNAGYRRSEPEPAIRHLFTDRRRRTTDSEVHPRPFASLSHDIFGVVRPAAALNIRADGRPARSHAGAASLCSGGCRLNDCPDEFAAGVIDPRSAGGARFLRTSAASTVDGIEKYLASGTIRGIGPIYAEKLVRVFPFA
jgi:hypothetical protein